MNKNEVINLLYPMGLFIYKNRSKEVEKGRKKKEEQIRNKKRIYF